MVNRAGRAVVFLVDDDDDLRSTFEQVLERDGHLVLPARDGHEALARMRSIAVPSVAVVDLSMPGMDGWALVRAMREDPGLRSIPILVVSGLTAPERGPIRGADRLLRKPCSPDELRAAVADLLPHPGDLVMP